MELGHEHGDNAEHLRQPPAALTPRSSSERQRSSHHDHEAPRGNADYFSWRGCCPVVTAIEDVSVVSIGDGEWATCVTRATAKFRGRIASSELLHDPTDATVTGGDTDEWLLDVTTHVPFFAPTPSLRARSETLSFRRRPLPSRRKQPRRSSAVLMPRRCRHASIAASQAQPAVTRTECDQQQKFGRDCRYVAREAISWLPACSASLTNAAFSSDASVATPRLVSRTSTPWRCLALFVLAGCSTRRAVSVGSKPGDA